MKKILSRTGATFVIAFIAALPAGLNLGHGSDLKAIGLTAIGAGIAAAIAFVKTAIWTPADGLPVWINVAERAAWTAVQGAAAALPAIIVWTKFGLIEAGWAAASGALAAVISLAKNLSGAVAGSLRS